MIKKLDKIVLPRKSNRTIFSNYTGALFQSVNEAIDDKYSYPPLSQQRLVSISFPTTESYAIDSTPTRKQKLFNDASSSIIVHTIDILKLRQNQQLINRQLDHTIHALCHGRSKYLR